MSLGKGFAPFDKEQRGNGSYIPFLYKAFRLAFVKVVKWYVCVCCSLPCRRHELMASRAGRTTYFHKAEAVFSKKFCHMFSLKIEVFEAYVRGNFIYPHRIAKISACAEYGFCALDNLLFGRFYARKRVIYAQVFILYLSHCVVGKYLHTPYRGKSIDKFARTV